MPGAKADLGSRHKKGDQGEGIKGLKALGVRDLNYRMAFLACSIAPMSMRVCDLYFFHILLLHIKILKS